MPKVKVIGSPINEPRYVQLDQRDWSSLRDRQVENQDRITFLEDAVKTANDRIALLEADNRRLHQQEALLINGVKERLDVFGVLLSGFEARLVGKDLG
jgi:hypothetical protein